MSFHFNNSSKLPKYFKGDIKVSPSTRYLNNLPEIIEGDLIIENNKHIKILKLPKIIKGNLILNSISAKEIYLPKIVQKSLHLISAYHIIKNNPFENTEYIGGDLEICFSLFENRNLSLPTIKGKSIRIYYTNIEEITFTSLSNSLNELYLSENELSNIRIPNNTKFIKEIDISKNHFKELPFNKNIHTETLIANSNKLKSLNNLPTIKNTLDILNNFVETLNIPHIKAKTLLADFNFIEDIKGPLNFENISLNSNKLKSIPQNTFPNKVNNLNLSNNQIKNLNFLPSSINTCLLNFNQITIIDLSNYNINELQLSGNKIYKIISLPNSIKSLILSNNNLKEFHINTKEPNLDFLDLSNNKIEDISINSEISELNLSNNKIKDISKINPTLKKLNLSNNPISSLNPLPNFEKLSFLDLSYSSKSHRNKKYKNYINLLLNKNEILNILSLKNIKSMTLILPKDVKNFYIEFFNLNDLIIPLLHQNTLKKSELKDLLIFPKFQNFPNFQKPSNPKNLKKSQRI